MTRIRPAHVAAWRDQLLAAGQTNAAISRKLSVIRSLFGDYLAGVWVRWRTTRPTRSTSAGSAGTTLDGKTVALTTEDCRQLLDRAGPRHPRGRKETGALLAVLAYTGCRVGEACRLRVAGITRPSGGHKVLRCAGRRAAEDAGAVAPGSAFERLVDAWLDAAGLRDAAGPLFRASIGRRGHGRHAASARAN